MSEVLDRVTEDEELAQLRERFANDDTMNGEEMDRLSFLEAQVKEKNQVPPSPIDQFPTTDRSLTPNSEKKELHKHDITKAKRTELIKIENKVTHLESNPRKSKIEGRPIFLAKLKTKAEKLRNDLARLAMEKPSTPSAQEVVAVTSPVEETPEVTQIGQPESDGEAKRETIKVHSIESLTQVIPQLPPQAEVSVPGEVPVVKESLTQTGENTFSLIPVQGSDFSIGTADTKPQLVISGDVNLKGLNLHLVFDKGQFKFKNEGEGTVQISSSSTRGLLSLKKGESCPIDPKGNNTLVLGDFQSTRLSFYSTEDGYQLVRSNQSIGKLTLGSPKARLEGELLGDPERLHQVETQFEGRTAATPKIRFALEEISRFDRLKGVKPRVKLTDPNEAFKHRLDSQGFLVEVTADNIDQKQVEYREDGGLQFKDGSLLIDGAGGLLFGRDTVKILKQSFAAHFKDVGEGLMTVDQVKARLKEALSTASTTIASELPSLLAKYPDLVEARRKSNREKNRLIEQWLGAAFAFAYYAVNEIGETVVVTYTCGDVQTFSLQGSDLKSLTEPHRDNNQILKLFSEYNSDFDENDFQVHQVNLDTEILMASDGVTDNLQGGEFGSQVSTSKAANTAANGEFNAEGFLRSILEATEKKGLKKDDFGLTWFRRRKPLAQAV
jgi:hypothetical protein